VRADGTGGERLVAYCSTDSHTWVQKAADLFGLGTDALRWIDTDDEQRLRVDALRVAIEADRAAGARPFIVIGDAGTVGTGAVDPLRELAALCAEEGLWFHVDGAYGGLAACLPEASDDLKALALADSVAIDPHKWLYLPVEAGCALVRDPQALLDTFSYRPPYYHLSEGQINYYEYGPQNSREFRALKVWLALRQAGRSGYESMIREDCRLARLAFDLADADPELEAATYGLSIATFRYAPEGVPEEELDALNEALLARLERDGEVFLSNAVVDGRYVLRLCIVNFRTTEEDIRALPEIVRRVGAEVAVDISSPSRNELPPDPSARTRPAGQKPLQMRRCARGAGARHRTSSQISHALRAARFCSRSCGACRPARRAGSQPRSPPARTGRRPGRGEAADGSGRRVPARRRRGRAPPDRSRPAGAARPAASRPMPPP
jgi:aromatic-L-amino-acid/L-tryptophan decarboxylase